MDPRRRCGADLRLVRPAPRLRQSRSRFAAKTVPSSSSIPTEATESTAREKTAAQNLPIKSLAKRRGRPCAQATVVDAFARAEVRSGGTPEPAGRMPTLPEIRPRPSGVCLFPKGGMRGSRAFRCGDPRRGKIGFLRIPSRRADGNEDPEFLSSPETKSGVPPEEGTPD